VYHGTPDIPGRCSFRHAFTLVETLVSLSVIAVLLSLLIPSLHSAREKMRTLKCASNVKSVVFEFQLFAEGLSEAGRGESDRLGASRFRIEDFQESLYGVDEFWRYGDVLQVEVSSADHLMTCPSAGAALTLIPGGPCEQSVGPFEDVSIALNMRLYRPVVRFRGERLLAPPGSAWMSPQSLNHPYAPLTIEVDGPGARSRGIDPFYIAPPVGQKDDPYADGRFWTPSTRHGGQTIVGFLGGHVLTSSHPATEHWDWSYSAETFGG